MMYDDDEPAVILSAGPAFSREAERDDPPYEPPRQPLGFSTAAELLAGIRQAQRLAREVDPLLWDGDQA